MNWLIAFLVSACFLLSVVYAENLCSSGWEQYKEEKCFKVLSQSATQSFANAQKACSANNNSKLISVRSQGEQTFLENYLFKQSSIVDNVWLGAKSDDILRGSPFKWEDGSSLTNHFSHWAPGNPKTNSSADNCLQMHAEDELRGRWSNEPCNRLNAVVCEKVLSSQASISQQQLEQLQATVHQLQQAVVSLQHNPVPLGFTYVQLPKEKSPEEIWPQTPELKWADVSEQYGSTFFRVAGSKSASFGAVQEASAPYVDQVKNSWCLGECSYVNETVLPRNGGWSESLSVAYTKGGDQQWYRAKLNFHVAGDGEVRPSNMAVKVWKRIA